MDDAILFLTIFNTVFSVINFYYIHTAHNQVNINGLMGSLSIMSFDQRLKNIEKLLGVPPAYEESPTPSLIPEDVSDEGTQIPYTPSPLPGEMPSFFSTPARESGLNDLD